MAALQSASPHDEVGIRMSASARHDMRPALLSTILIAAFASSGTAHAACADGKDCRRKTTKAAPAHPEPKRFEPYDPDRARSGSRPGFVDVGGGTEVRVGGRTRVEYGYTR